MPARRLEAGPLLALLGAAVLLVSLFLDWYAPGLSAWDVFELLDLVLAGLAVAGGVAAVSALGGLAAGPDPRTLPWIAGAAVVLVLGTVLDHPPAVGPAETRTGLWLALVGAVLMALGALLVAARVRIVLDIEGRRRRVRPVERRGGADASSSGGSSRRDAASAVRAGWDAEGASDDDASGSRLPAFDDDPFGGEPTRVRRSAAVPPPPPEPAADDPVGPPAFDEPGDRRSMFDDDDEPGRRPDA